MPIRKAMKKRYPADWKVRSRFIRFYRAKGKCEQCGVGHGEIRNGRKVVLAAAHVYDKRPEMASLMNLMALCQLCHNILDAKDRHDGMKERRHVPPDIEGQFLMEFK